MNTVIYKMSGVFYPGMVWEDFIAQTENTPNVTIEAIDPDGLTADTACVFAVSDDGWFDAYVYQLNRDTALAVLSILNPGAHIVIEELGVCLAV